MKKFKKATQKLTAITISLIMVVVLVVVALPLQAMAATPAEQVIAALNSVQARFPNDAQVANSVSQARTWLSNPENAATITDTAASSVISNVNSALAIAGNATSLSDLSRDQLLAIQGFVERAAGAASLTAAVAVTGNVWTITVIDETGAAVFSATNRDPIQQTGIDATMLIAIIIGITLIFGAAIIVAVYTKKRQHSAA